MWVFEALKEYTVWLARMFIIGVIICYLYSLTPIGRDDSDNGDGWFGARSNMAVRIDHLTGCEYLESSKGVLVPRVDGQKQIGCKHDHQ